MAESSVRFLSELLGETSEFAEPVDEFGRVISSSEVTDSEGVHFIAGQEARALGVGFFKFSQNEALRAQQQLELSLFRSSTEDERSLRERRIDSLRKRRDMRLLDYTKTSL